MRRYWTRSWRSGSPAAEAGRCRAGSNARIQVRVVEYRLEGVADAGPLYRLVTTILDPAAAPAAELAALYHERWEIEGALDELKTHLRGARMVSCAARRPSWSGRSSGACRWRTSPCAA